MKKRVSLKDIADELGVSITLVSWVINGKEKEGRVGKEMADKIREAAIRMNYQPNYIARSLKTNITNSIGLILADISNPFFANLARIIEDEAAKHDYTLVIGSSDEDPLKMQKILSFFTSRQVDGFIIVPSEGSYNLIKDLQLNKVPFVLIDRYFDEISSNCILIDNYDASYNATKYLIERGARKIGFITYKSSLAHFSDRARGYREALQDSGINVDKDYCQEVRYSNLSEDIKHAVDHLLDLKVSSIFFSTNSIALEGLKNLMRRGIKIPEEIEIIAFDSSDVYQFFDFPVPHVSQPIRKIGIESVNTLLQGLKDKTEKISKVVFKAELVLSEQVMK